MSPQGVALGYEPPTDRNESRVWIPQGGRHRVGPLGESQRRKLVSAVLELKVEAGARLVVLGVEVDGLAPPGRAALRERIGFLPADGGLISNLNAWENIVLPIGFHHPERAPGAAARVNGLIRELGVDPSVLLAMLPEKMSPYEKKLTGYVRIMLDRPDLMLAEEAQGGPDAAEGTAAERFSAVYLESCPGGTFVHLEIAPER